jgi:hypothetical protein
MHFDEKEANSAADFNHLLSEIKTGDIILFLIQLRQSSQLVAIRIE